MHLLSLTLTPSLASNEDSIAQILAAYSQSVPCTVFSLIPAMALQLLHTATLLPAYIGLKAAPSVRQVENLPGVGCARRSSASQSVTAVMNPMDDPILKDAMKEPIAFLGGVFAGLLRLDVNEEPLKDWVAKTAEAAGIDLDDSQAADMDDAVPEDIQID